MEAACSYLQDLLKEEKSREGSRIYPFLAIHYAHFIRRHSGDVEGGRKVRGCAWGPQRGRRRVRSGRLPAARVRTGKAAPFV